MEPTIGTADPIVGTVYVEKLCFESLTAAELARVLSLFVPVGFEIHELRWTDWDYETRESRGLKTANLELHRQGVLP